jgi:uroporphyrinogen-III synthase
MILLTRPLAQSRRFLAELQAELGDVDVRVSPLMAAEFFDPPYPSLRFSAVIFASETAVEAATQLKCAPDLPKTAFCVGQRTAKAAQANGFETSTAQGDAQSLIKMILAAGPTLPLLFLRGEDSVGEVAETLNSAGLETVSLVVYRQTALRLTDQAAQHLLSLNHTILPLFSPRSARLMLDECNRIGVRSPISVAALSDAVARAAQSLATNGLETAERKDSAAMVQAVAKLLTRAASP